MLAVGRQASYQRGVCVGSPLSLSDDGGVWCHVVGSSDVDVNGRGWVVGVV